MYPIPCLRWVEWAEVRVKLLLLLLLGFVKFGLRSRDEALDGVIKVFRDLAWWRWGALSFFAGHHEWLRRICDNYVEGRNSRGRVNLGAAGVREEITVLGPGPRVLQDEGCKACDHCPVISSRLTVRLQAVRRCEDAVAYVLK